MQTNAGLGNDAIVIDVYCNALAMLFLNLPIWEVQNTVQLKSNNN